MTDLELSRDILQTISHGVALIDAESGALRLENAQFFKLFPPRTEVEDDSIERIPKFDLARAKARIRDNGYYSYDVETPGGSPPVPVSIEIKAFDSPSGDLLIIECRDNSKVAEAQYMLDSYSKLAERNASELSREKERVEKLLLNIMPKSVYEELKDSGTTSPQKFEDTSVLMLDFARFTEMEISHNASSLVSELNDIFSSFDRIVEMFDCERIRTIGDSYMAVSGLPEPREDNSHNIARIALRMRRYIEKRNTAHREQWQCRIGINTGTVIGSLVGVQKYVYDLFGPGVNLASRMETLSDPMRITISESTYQKIKDEFVCSERGPFDVKGFGTMNLYFLESEIK
jgi:adenylate cyclase